MSRNDPVKYSLVAVRLMASVRPPGYLEEILSVASSVTATHVSLAPAVDAELRLRFGSAHPTPAQSSGPRSHFTGYDGSMVWAQIHGQANPSSETLQAAFMEIPCWDCRGHAYELLKRRPADFSSLENYFWWSVDYHDDVSRSIGKPEFGRAAAAARYGRTLPSKVA